MACKPLYHRPPEEQGIASDPIPSHCTIFLTGLIFIFIAGRPKAALLFWFFADFRCGALLFMVIFIYIYLWKLLFTWLSLVMSMIVSFGAVLFPTRCLG